MSVKPKERLKVLKKRVRKVYIFIISYWRIHTHTSNLTERSSRVAVVTGFGKCETCAVKRKQERRRRQCSEKPSSRARTHGSKDNTGRREETQRVCVWEGVRGPRVLWLNVCWKRSPPFPNVCPA